MPSVGLNKPCNKGTLLSQSVVDSLALPGKEPTLNVGAVPVEPGSRVPPGTRIGITWSGCYGNAVVVPDVVGPVLRRRQRRHHRRRADLGLLLRREADDEHLEHHVDVEHRRRAATATSLPSLHDDTADAGGSC